MPSHLKTLSTIVTRQRNHPCCPPKKPHFSIPQQNFHHCCCQRCHPCRPPTKNLNFVAHRKYHPCQPPTKHSSLPSLNKSIIHAATRRSYHSCLCPLHVELPPILLPEETTIHDADRLNYHRCHAQLFQRRQALNATTADEHHS